MSTGGDCQVPLITSMRGRPTGVITVRNIGGGELAKVLHLALHLEAAQAPIAPARSRRFRGRVIV
jgi:hypothetical protein